MKIHLSKSPQVFMRLNDEVVPRKRMYIERLTFDFIREPFTCNWLKKHFLWLTMYLLCIY
jgi:hypothetical protein